MSTHTASQIAQAFVDYLKEQERYDQLAEIVEALQNEVVRNQDISVISALPLSDQEKKELEIVLSHKWGIHPVSYAVDPAVISGYLVRFNDTVIDCSGRHDLQDLYQTLNQ